jgi:hypothetical protein
MSWSRLPGSTSLARSKCVIPASYAVVITSVIRSNGWEAPKFCHNPSEITGSRSADFPATREGIGAIGTFIVTTII